MSDDTIQPVDAESPATAPSDVSIDLETLSTDNDAVILSIGATKFNIDTGEIFDTYYVEVKVNDALLHGSVNGDTLSWWMRQSDQARELFAEGNTKLNLTDALRGLTAFVGLSTDLSVWGNGATFDVSILDHAYRSAHNATAPWKFWKVRDMRTLVDVATRMDFDRQSIPFQGTPHHAGDDSAHQARVIAAAWHHVTSLQPAEEPQSHAIGV